MLEALFEVEALDALFDVDTLDADFEAVADDAAFAAAAAATGLYTKYAMMPPIAMARARPTPTATTAITSFCVSCFDLASSLLAADSVSFASIQVCTGTCKKDA